jgi:hypothetical protein
VFSQVRQLSVSGVTFRNNVADVGAVMFTEAVEVELLRCMPTPCDWEHSNTAVIYGVPFATPPVTFVVTSPVTVRSGAPLPISVTLTDGCAPQPASSHIRARPGRASHPPIAPPQSRSHQIWPTCDGLDRHVRHD